MKPADYSTATLDTDAYLAALLAPPDVHAAQRLHESVHTTNVFLAFASIFSVLHGLNLYLFIGSGMWPAIPLIIHSALVLIAFIITYANYKKGMDVEHMLLMSIMATVTGVFGTIGALFGFGAGSFFRTDAEAFATTHAALFPGENPAAAKTISDAITDGMDSNIHPYTVMPFADIMRLGSEAQKRRALTKMTAQFSPRFAHAFALALGDASHSIRVQAATAVAHIERQFAHTLEQIELARTHDPKNANLTLALAKLYDNYAFSGILGEQLERLNRDRAIGTYQSYLKQHPHSTEARLAVGRLLLRNQQLSEAADWFRQALDRGMKPHNVVLWYFECLFRLGQFRELRRAVVEYGRSIAPQENLPAHVRHAVSLWIQAAA